MELLGCNLDQLHTKHNRKFSISTTIKIAEQLVNPFIIPG